GGGPTRGGPPLRRRGDDDPDKSDRGRREVPGPRHRVASARPPPKAYYATVGFAARWGGDEGTLGREVSTEELGRGRRPGGDRRAPPSLREDGKPSPPPLRGSGGDRQDDVCDRPGPRHVRRELAPELLRIEQQRRARHRHRPDEGQGDRAPRPVRRDEFQDHLPR